MGSFEGYVPTATDLYLRGNNIANWSGANLAFDTGQITSRGTPDYLRLEAGKTWNLSGFTKVNVQCDITVTYKKHGVVSRMAIMLSDSDSNILGTYGTPTSYPINEMQVTARYNGSYSIPFKKDAATAIRLRFALQQYYENTGTWFGNSESIIHANSAIYRIWLS